MTLTASCGIGSFLPENLTPSEGKLEVREVSLGRMAVSHNEIRISPDPKRVAFKIKEGGKERIVVDGQQGPAYDSVDLGTVFSPDSKRVGYLATRNGLQFVVIDGVEGKGYEPWSRMYLVFSPDSTRVAFRARVGNSAVMVIDGVEGKSYKSIGPAEWPDVFSPDSKRTSYAGEVGEKEWVAVVDGVEGTAYRSIESLQFSPDSRRVLYEAVRDNACFVVVDGVEGPKFESISMYSSGHFSPDSRRVAYRASRRFKTYTMVLDSVAGKEYEDIEIAPICFSPDSKHLAYIAKVGAKQCVVMDEKEGPLYQEVERPRFSPDGKLTYAARGEHGAVTVYDGKEIASGRAVFSPDWQHSAYAVRRGLKWTVVYDGKDGLQHGLGEMWRTNIFFSPDSQRMGYFASQARQVEFVVVDGVQSIRYQLVNVGDSLFSPNSKHFAYWACPASGGWRIFVDGSYTEAYKEPILNSKLVFDGPNTLHGLAVRNGEILRVGIKIVPNAEGQPRAKTEGSFRVRDERRLP